MTLTNVLQGHNTVVMVWCTSEYSSCMGKNSNAMSENLTFPAPEKKYVDIPMLKACSTSKLRKYIRADNQLYALVTDTSDAQILIYC